MTDSPNLENEAGNFKVDLQAIRERAESWRAHLVKCGLPLSYAILLPTEGVLGVFAALDGLSARNSQLAEENERLKADRSTPIAEPAFGMQTEVGKWERRG